MPLQSLAIPIDITWQRLGYAREMMDDSFGNLSVPSKWRSSLAIFGYVVPQDQTVEAYPNQRILYLKLSCSITGFNPSEELLASVDLQRERDRLDDLQYSAWEVIQGQRWAETYWPCLGAIAQVAADPPQGTNVHPDEFPCDHGL